MSLGVPSLAEPFSRQVRGHDTHLAALMASPEVTLGFFDTSSLSSLVTDSAAAATSWGSGSRVFNKSINVLPDGTPMQPIMQLAKRPGRGLGLVTTATVTHATPAGFASVQEHRDDEHLIAPQYNGTVDVVLGGGRRFFDAATNKSKVDVLGQYASSGYLVLDTREQLLAAPRDKRLLGLFSDGHVPYTVDHLASDDLKASVPTLAEMTRAALAHLVDKPEGFLLQVEGARVDHAAHGNDAAAILHDQLAFDDAVGVALEFAAQHGDTLVVVTSDHGNSNPGLNGIGDEYKDSTGLFEKLAGVRTSFGPVRDAIVALAGKDNNPTPDQVRQVTSEVLGFPFTSMEADAIAGTLTKTARAVIEHQKSGFASMLGSVLSNYVGIGWTGSQHTQDHTIILAIGPGQERWHGLHRNTDAFGLMADAMGIVERNPSMTPEQARPLLEQKLAAGLRVDHHHDDWA